MSFIFVCAVGLLAGTISGIVGTGSSIMLMPVLVYEFGPKQAVPIMAVAAVMANLSRIMAWWRRHGIDPREKLIIFSDGLDVDKMSELFLRFQGRVKVSFGWGTLLTNDFRGLVPGDGLAPFSLVCKAVAADGHPTVKLSDNPEKATGPAQDIARYRQVFEVGQQRASAVVV